MSWVEPLIQSLHLLRCHLNAGRRPRSPLGGQLESGTGDRRYCLALSQVRRLSRILAKILDKTYDWRFLLESIVHWIIRLHSHARGSMSECTYVANLTSEILISGVLCLRKELFHLRVRYQIVWHRECVFVVYASVITRRLMLEHGFGLVGRLAVRRVERHVSVRCSQHAVYLRF